MNNILVVFEPSSICFFDIDKVSVIEKIPLLFYLNSKSGKLYYNFNYYPYLLFNTSNNFFNNFYKLIEDNQNFRIDNFAFSPLDFIKSVLNKYTDSKLFVSFSSNISENTRNKILSLTNSTAIDDFEKIIAKTFLLKNNITESKSLNIFVNFNHNLSASIVCLNGKDLEIKEKYFFEDLIYEPFWYQLSTTICNNSYKIYNIPPSEPVEKDIIFTYYKLLILKPQFRPDKENYIFSISIEKSKEPVVVRVNINEVHNLSVSFIKKILFTVNNSIALDNEHQYVFFGKFFENEDVTNVFKTFTKKINIISVSDLLTYLFKPLSLSESQPKEQIISLEKLYIKKLKIGDKIKLSNYDPRPDKGWAYQFFEYIGDNRFIVIDSTRGLKPGDIIETKDEFWNIKTKIIVEVYRANKPFGKFESREIQKIEIIPKNP